MALERPAVLLLSSLLLACTCAFAAAQNVTAVDPSRAPAPAVPVTPSSSEDKGALQPQAIASIAATKPGGAAQPKKSKATVHIAPKAKVQGVKKQAVQTKAAKQQRSKTAQDEYSYDSSDNGAQEDPAAYPDDEGEQNTDVVLEYCPSWRPGTNNQGVTAADRPEPMLNVFSELTLDEYNAVLLYLRSLSHLALDDLDDDDAQAKTVLNYIHAIHMEAPPKSDVCGHLDADDHIPPRKARVTVVMGKAEPPSVHDVLVTIKYENGHPVASNLQHTNILSSKWSSVPYVQRPQGVLDENGAHMAIEAVVSDLNQFLGSAFKGWAYGEECSYTYKCIDWTLTYAQHFSDDLPRGAYIQFYWNDSPVNDGNYIHPIPLQMLVAAKGKDLAHWYVHKVWFNGACFESVKDLKHAWNTDKDGLKTNWDYSIPEDDSGIYSTFDARHGKQRAEEQPVGPIVWQPYGRRFTITGGNRIAWLGWSLYVGYLPHYGPRFWDLKFKGERIAYELSMQEAMTMYGGDDLTQTNGVFLDSAFGLGYNFRPLNQGIDCPMNSAFMDVTVFYGGMPKPKTFKNAICIFERHTDVPLMRHYSSTFKFYGAVPGAELVVRMMSTVYNIDYIHDLELSVGGGINVKVYTSGYVQTGPLRPSYPKHHGYPLFHDVAGTLQTQVIAWKVDLDIAGTSNSVKMHKLKLTEADNGAGHKVWVNKYDAKIAKTETDTAHRRDPHAPIIPVIVNEDDTNIWGSPRGYKVQLHSVVEDNQPDESARKKGLDFWKWHFVATRHKDLETHSSSCFTQSDLTNPPNTLCDYIDGEGIRKKDIVVWVNSGRYHIPSAEDTPVTSTANGVLGFSLLPFNWGDESPATDMVNMLQIDRRAKDTSNYIKDSLQTCAPSFETVAFLKDLSSYGKYNGGGGGDGGDDDDDSGSSSNNYNYDTDYFWGGGNGGSDGSGNGDNGDDGDGGEGAGDGGSSGGGSGTGGGGGAADGGYDGSSNGSNNGGGSGTDGSSGGDGGEGDGEGEDEAEYYGKTMGGAHAKLAQVRAQPKFETVRRMVPMVTTRGGSRAAGGTKEQVKSAVTKTEELKPWTASGGGGGGGAAAAAPGTGGAAAGGAAASNKKQEAEPAAKPTTIAAPQVPAAAQPTATGGVKQPEQQQQPKVAGSNPAAAPAASGHKPRPAGCGRSSRFSTREC